MTIKKLKMSEMVKKIKLKIKMRGYIAVILLATIFINIFLIFPLSLPLVAQEQPQRSNFNIGFGKVSDVRENLVKYVEEGETTDASIFISNAGEVKSLWIKIYLNIENLSISQLKPVKDYCSVWDQEPVYSSEGYIEVLCAPSGDVSEGKILDLKVLPIGVKEKFVTLEVTYLSGRTNSIQTKLENSTLTIIDETTGELVNSQAISENQIQQTSGDLTDSNSDESQIILVINIVLIFGIFITLFLGFRSLRLTRQEDKFINRN
jgi:hypothetical protein